MSGVPAEATSVTHDSRRVTKGGIFVAIPGMSLDGNSFIPAAVAAGARFIIVQADARPVWERYADDDVTVVAVPDARVALAEASAGFYEHPTRSIGMVGVTGTDGKTTTTHLVAHVLNVTGTSAGYLSSVAFGVGDVTEQNVSHMTTLEAPHVQRCLAQIRDGGGRYGVVEASSIGLDLHRVDQCDFDVAVFTNLTRDHLDYHKSMEAYAAAKARLFAMLDTSPAKAFA